MLGLIISLLMAPQTVEHLRQLHDGEVRAQNAEHDWWLVSTTGSGLKQNRFYIDRTTSTSMESQSKGWIDHYEIVRSSPRIEMSHDMVLAEAKCDGDPQLRFKSGVKYSSSGAATPMTGAHGDWSDVVPGSSMETIWRFICHSEPANAIGYVPDGPAADAARFFKNAHNR